jgi:hypothetical protein
MYVNSCEGKFIYVCVYFFYTCQELCMYATLFSKYVGIAEDWSSHPPEGSNPARNKENSRYSRLNLKSN